MTDTYWRLSFFYFSYFAFMGAFMPFWSLYLQSLSFTAVQIGTLMSLFQVGRIVAPAIWGWLADHTGQRIRITQMLTVMSFLVYLGVFAKQSYGWIFAIMLLLSFFWSAALPLLESITLGHLRDNLARYGHIRLWGSLGFIAAVIGLGILLDYQPIATLLVVILGILLLVMFAGFAITDAPATAVQAATGSLRQIMQKREVISLLLACFCMAMAHGAYYTFYSIFLVEHGYSKGAVGWLWALGVVCEIVLFLCMPKLTQRFSYRQILLASLLLAFVRFVVIGWSVQHIVLIILAQTLHAASFGTFHASAIAKIHQYFQGKHQARGQALYTGFYYGLGGTLGALMSGFAWEHTTAAWTFSLCAVFALIGIIILAWGMPAEENAY